MVAPRTTALIGPLAATSSVVRRLQQHHHYAPGVVTVLTTRSEIVSEPSWELVRSDHELLSAAVRRAGQAQLLMIDVPADIPVWLTTLLDRLTMAGLECVRLVVDGRPTGDELTRLETELGRAHAVDLVTKVPPRLVLDLLDAGHPIASVGGAPINPEFLLALREEVSHGPSR